MFCRRQTPSTAPHRSRRDSGETCRLELRTKGSLVPLGGRHKELQGEQRAGALEVVEFELVQALRQVDLPPDGRRCMLAVVVDDQVVVDQQSRAVVRDQPKAIKARCFGFERASILDSEPLKSVADPG